MHGYHVYNNIQKAAVGEMFVYVREPAGFVILSMCDNVYFIRSILAVEETHQN